jgi:hypothetical protein
MKNNRREFFKNVGKTALVTTVASLPFSQQAIAADLDVLLASGNVTLDSLQFVREEEKLARDVYIGLYDVWGSRIFSNISGSEQTHTDAVKFLLNKYQYEDPAAHTAIGEFVNPKIQNWYNDLMARGQQSSLDALYVGAYIEELDIGDLRHEIDLSQERDVRRVYTNLMNGSYNHLRAFVGRLESQGIEYKAQLLEQNDVDQILISGGQQGAPRRR